MQAFDTALNNYANPRATTEQLARRIFNYIFMLERNRRTFVLLMTDQYLLLYGGSSFRLLEDGGVQFSIGDCLPIIFGPRAVQCYAENLRAFVRMVSYNPMVETISLANKRFPTP